MDDNDRNAKLVRDVLGAEGIRTLVASDAAQAIALAAEHLPDLVLLDLRLRDADGADVARELGVRTPQIPVVALSALDAPRADDMREAGFVGYLQKPISVARLPSQVRGYCRERPAPRR